MTLTYHNQQEPTISTAVRNPRSLSKKELQTMREAGAIQSTTEIFPTPMSLDDPTIIVDHYGNPVLEAFAQWVMELGRCCRKEIKPVFVHHDTQRILADCTINTQNPQMRFNLRNLSEEWFTGRGDEQLALIIHELGHAHLQGEVSHGPQWGEACAQVGAMIALRINRESDPDSTGNTPKDLPHQDKNLN